MKKIFSISLFSVIRQLTIWTLLILPISIVTGSLVAFFLWLLEKATATRQQHLWLVGLLPAAGVVIVFLYKKWGKNVVAGNNLIIDEIHEPGGGIPFQMAPLVLVSTVVTHLFGGSAGREGTAVQMGGSVAALFSKWYRTSAENRRLLLMCGIAAGFGAVFGTPVAGAVFALEVLTIGKVKYDGLIPCLASSVLADVTCSLYGIQHTHYQIVFIQSPGRWLPLLSIDLWLLAKVIIAGGLFGLVASLFARSAHFIKYISEKFIRPAWLIPVVGGLLVIVISLALGTSDYLGLGVTHPTGGVSIIMAFSAGGATYFSWFWKLLLTVITLSTGFKGGEVTPLFFIGATLGNTLALLSGSPVDLFAGLGFIAVFAGATNTPLACILMGVELFGANNIVYYAVACFTAYYFRGHTGIYSSQRMETRKF